MTGYAVYGKHVSSNYPLPLPAVGNSASPEITLSFEGVVPRYTDPSTLTTARTWKQTDEGFELCFYNREGHTIVFRYNQSGTYIRLSQTWPQWSDSLFSILNPGLAASLFLQGEYLLHASSMVTGGTAFLIAGESGAGKSSLSGALAAEGVATHSDDIAVIGKEDDRLFVQAGYPRIKMHPETARVVGLPAEQMIPISSRENEEGERWFKSEDLPGGSHPHKAPLGGICILSERNPELKEPHIQQLSSAAAAIELATHRYGRDWLEYPNRQVLEHSALLAASVPVYRLNLPDDTELLKSSARSVMRACMQPATPSVTASSS